MLPIPSILLDKVNQAMQTIGNNAEPKMTIIAQKAAKYLNQGSFLNARTIRTGNSLGPLDVCLRREDKYQDPTEIVMLYVEGGYAKVATIPYVHSPDQNFSYQYTIGPATDVACDFDGRFEFIEDHSGIYFDTETIWALVTFGDPYFSIVSSGALTIWQGQTQIISLAGDSIVKCSLLRGWKSINHVLTDQGIICAYTKTDGKVYYRAFCEQEGGSFIWELEHEITEFVPPVSNLGLFRAADFRTGFLAEINGNIQLLLTIRSWSAMGILPDHIFSMISNVQVEVFEILYQDFEHPDEHISSTISNINAGVAGAANTGNGGNGANKGASQSGGAGGSGVVIISYATADFGADSSGGVKTVVGINTIHRFTSSGTLTLTSPNPYYSAYRAIINSCPLDNNDGGYTADSYILYEEALALCNLTLTAENTNEELAQETIAIQAAYDLLVFAPALQVLVVAGGGGGGGGWEGGGGGAGGYLYESNHTLPPGSYPVFVPPVHSPKAPVKYRIITIPEPPSPPIPEPLLAPAPPPPPVFGVPAPPGVDPTCAAPPPCVAAP